MSAYQLPVWVWPTALMVACGLAVWRGRDEERLAAAGLLANWALTLVVFRSRSQETQWAILALDSALLALYMWIALRTRRFWPLPVAGFQLLCVVTHVAHAVDPRVSGWAYLTAGIVWSYLILFTISYGAWTAPRYAETDDEPNAAFGAMRR
ncbi:MAG: hypothetical protein GC203_05245 [Phenylobacterium sp.]|uniref:hypothetical protein n=1 Tax=Phenylobacterium sp. TaxID=1871053 RepID=UPI0025EA43A7|nr:hypothetical protein [Phenylobacterium sp.]MBI1197250.1 hypothetical protein [Phenylobacterium sp.]